MTGRVRDPAKVAEAVRLRKLGWKYAAIAAQTGLSVHSAWGACNRERQRELGRLSKARYWAPVVCPTCGHRKRQRRAEG